MVLLTHASMYWDYRHVPQLHLDKNSCLSLSLASISPPPSFFPSSCPSLPDFYVLRAFDILRETL